MSDRNIIAAVVAATVLFAGAMVGWVVWRGRSTPPTEAEQAVRPMHSANDTAAAPSSRPSPARVGPVVRARGYLASAKSIARAIVDGMERSEAFRQIAETEFDTADRIGALAALAEARAATDSIRDRGKRLLAHIGIARSRSRCVDAAGAKQAINDALAIAVDLDPASGSTSAFESIAHAQIDGEDFDGATKIATYIGDDATVKRVLWRMAVAQAERGKVDAAIATAARITDRSDRDLALREVAVCRARKGDVKGAVAALAAVAAEMSFLADEVITALAEAGNGADAKRLAEWYGRPSAMQALAEGRAKAGDIAGAQATLQAMQKANSEAGRFGHDWELKLRNAMAAIASAQAKAGQIAAAITTLEQIAVEDRYTRERVLVDIARAQAAAGDVLAAKITAAPIENARCRFDALCGIAAETLKAGDIKQSREAFWRAVALAGGDRELGPSRVSWTAVQQARGGDPETAMFVISAIPTTSDRDWVRSAVVEAYLQLGDTAMANSVLSRMEPGDLRRTAARAIGASIVGEGDVTAFTAWIDQLPSQTDQVFAYLGAIRGLSSPARGTSQRIN
jgi:hypothetical protein